MSYSGDKNEVARLTAVVPGEYMSQIALFIKHRTLPGKRDEVRGVWEQHMAPAIAANPGHTAYFYCYDNADPDVICAFQQYASAEAARSFLQNDSYLAYLKEVEPLLSGSPEVVSLVPVWSKSSSTKASAKADVDAFLRDLKHGRKDDIAAVRAIVRAADKKLVERIKWNAPSYGYDDDRVTFRLQPKDVVQLIFHRGAKKRTDAFVFEDATGLLEWLADDRGAVTFKDQADIHAKQAKLTRLIKSWLKATC